MGSAGTSRVLLAGMLLLGVSLAQREVSVQQGPLYRTLGSHISIWCRVSGYQGPSQQNFLWSIYLPSAPDREVQIVSTSDASFSYAIYSQRVRSGDIYVERVAGDHALLHITQLQERDSGEYECHTPNTDPTYHGSYSAKMNLRVIPDTLNIKMTPQDLGKKEGDPMDLTCEVSKASSQHTHLSVTWLLDSGEIQEIITLSQDFVQQPGPNYQERFSSGHLRLDKLQDTTYRLYVMGAQESDQGDIICQASEWIQDPDGIWTEITKKQSEKTKLTVSAVTGWDFEVQIMAPEAPLILGSPLEVTCSISTQELAGRRFQVTWLLNNSMLVTLSPSGIPSIGGQFGTQETIHHVAVGRMSLRSWYLRINHIQLQDVGSYMCQVSEEESGERLTKSRWSSPKTVTLKDSDPEVSIRSDAAQVHEGDAVVLTCEVTRLHGSVSVMWFMINFSGQWTEMASIEREGEVTITQYDAGHLEAYKLGNGLFTLKLHSVRAMARYGCQVTVWAQVPSGDWKNVHTHSKDMAINVTPLNVSLRSTLSVRSPKVKLGDTVSLSCTVSAAYSFSQRPLVWSWHFLPTGDTSGTYKNLVFLSQNGSLSWDDSVPSFQGKAQLWLSETKTTLRIYQTQRGQAGSFSCTVGVLSKETGVPQASATSNKVMIKVNIGSQLMLDSASRSLLVTIGQEQLTVQCHILSVTPGSAHSLTWFFKALSSMSPQEILRVSREGVLSYSSSSLTQSSRILSEKVSVTTYLLHILRPQQALRGLFYCAVQEWLLEEDGDWTKLGESSSGATTVEFHLPDKSLNIPKTNRSLRVMEADDVLLLCPLDTVRSSTSLYSVSWYSQGSPQPRLLYRVGWDWMIDYDTPMARRLQLVTTSRGNYSLALLNVEMEDAGAYYCQVEEWRLGGAGEDWRIEASDVSGYVEVTVSPPEQNLSVNLTGFSLSMPAAQRSLSLPCQVLSRSHPGSALSVAWWKCPWQLVFRVSHDGLFNYSSEGGLRATRLQFERLSELEFQISILQPEETDTGVYHCSVQEWIKSPRGVWYPAVESRSGNFSISVLPAGSLFQSQICSSSSLFYFFVICCLLLLMLVTAAICMYLRTWRKGRGDSRLKTQKGLWSSVKASSIPMSNGTETEEEREKETEFASPLND